MDAGEIAAAIKQELSRRGTTAYRASLDAGMPGNAIRYVLEERATKSDRLAEICDALGLEFYIGPPRDEAPQGTGDAPAVPLAITQLLGQPQDAGIDDVMAAIEERFDAGGDGAEALQEKMADVVRTEIAGLVARLDPGDFRRIREIDLVFPTMVFLASRSDGTATTREIIDHLEDRFRPSGEDAETLKGRVDSRFSQIVRNMISHRDSAHSFIGNGYADYLKDPGGLRITDKGRKLLAEMADGV